MTLPKKDREGVTKMVIWGIFKAEGGGEIQKSEKLG